MPMSLTGGQPSCVGCGSDETWMPRDALLTNWTCWPTSMRTCPGFRPAELIVMVVTCEPPGVGDGLVGLPLEPPLPPPPPHAAAASAAAARRVRDRKSVV